MSVTKPGLDDREVLPRPIINNRFTSEKETDLFIEVIAEPSPGAYDLKVSRN